MTDKQAPPKPKRKQGGGRPSPYTPELGREICARIATGDLSLARLSKEPGMPGLRTLFDWLNAHEEFAKQMAEARRLRADRHRDKIEDLVEQVAIGKIDPHSARVSIDGLKWLAGVERPDKYGERYRAEHVISKGPDVESDSVSEQWLNRLL